MLYGKIAKNSCHLIVRPAAHFTAETLGRNVVGIERLHLGVVERVPLVLVNNKLDRFTSIKNYFAVE